MFLAAGCSIPDAGRRRRLCRRESGIQRPASSGQAGQGGLREPLYTGFG